MSIKNILQEDCMGCMVCGDLCPTNAITFKENKEGFLYPVVDEAACISCGLCEKRCPVNTEAGTTLGKCPNLMDTMKAYAVSCKEDAVLIKSASGGVFPMLAAAFLEAGGFVYGAGYSQEWKVCHKGISGKEEIVTLQSSKYAQSDLSGVYQEVKDKLKQGQKVMFSGTPCQIAALKNYLNHHYENLLCVDLFCHGISSPGLFRKYLAEEVQAEPQDICSISFRDKTKGWENYRMRIVTKEKEYTKRFDKDAFSQAFCRKLSLRTSCYTCKAKGFPKKSDITLGDFWLVDRIFPDMNHKKGTSIVLVHTEEGRKWFDRIDAKAQIREIPKEFIKEMYAVSGRPSHKPADRERYFETVEKKGLAAAMKAYGRTPWKERLVTDGRKFLVKCGVYNFLRKLKHR